MSLFKLWEHAEVHSICKQARADYLFILLHLK